MIELIDEGYCANNPTLYAIADAIMALKLPPEKIRVVSVGVDVYPSPKQSWFSTMRWAQKLLSVQLLQKTLEINTQSMDQLRHVLFRHIPTVRISDAFEQPEMATDLFEHNMTKPPKKLPGEARPGQPYAGIASRPRGRAGVRRHAVGRALPGAGQGAGRRTGDGMPEGAHSSDSHAGRRRPPDPARPSGCPMPSTSDLIFCCRK
jgi:hypothetical protein